MATNKRLRAANQGGGAPNEASQRTDQALSAVGVSDVVLPPIDGSAMQEIETKLRLMSKVFEDAADPIIIENLNGDIIDLNGAAERALGWRREELLGKKSTMLIPAHVSRELARLRVRCRRAEHVRDVETELLRKSGKTIPISLTLSRLSDATAVPVAMAWNAKDISRRKKAEQERTRYAEQLEATNVQLRESIELRKLAEAEAREQSRRREEFIAILSHELRNPLGALLNAARVLDRVAAAADQAPCRVIQRQARQMARLLDDLLDVSRVAHGKIEIRREVVDLTALVDDALTVVSPLIESREHTLDVDIPERPLYVEGDSARLLQVIQNLLVNAAKYTPQQGRIALRMRRDGDAFEIRVQDNGIGISAEMVDRVFDMFVQSRELQDGSGGGMGIGLTLVRHLVELQNGAVAVESDGVGQGSTFIVRLPATDLRPLAADHSRSSTLQEVLAARIVLVEDNADAREMLKTLLEMDGHRVVLAADGRQGLASILAEKPDFAIIDIGLPELDGLEVARQVRASSLDDRVCLIALTGYGQQQDHEAVLSAGFDAHLVKPVNLDELCRLLQARPKRT